MRFGKIMRSPRSSYVTSQRPNGYSDADLKMNGQEQTTDINNIIYPNIG